MTIELSDIGIRLLLRMLSTAVSWCSVILGLPPQGARVRHQQTARVRRKPPF